MILVVAGRGAWRPLGLAGAATPADLTVLEPSGLSVPGWAHDPEAPGNDRMVLGGEILTAAYLRPYPFLPPKAAAGRPARLVRSC